jgi:hypothetical protein
MTIDIFGTHISAEGHFGEGPLYLVVSWYFRNNAIRCKRYVMVVLKSTTKLCSLLTIVKTPIHWREVVSMRQ